MAELPGTPGTPLPPAPGEPVVSQGQSGPLNKRLNGIPLPQIPSGQGGLNDDSLAPDEPVTAGVMMGPGAGPESLIPSTGGLTSRLTAEQMQYAYPLIMRLATLPNATSETKIMAQRIRASLPVSPEQMPVMDPSRRPPGRSDLPADKGPYSKRPNPGQIFMGGVGPHAAPPLSQRPKNKKPPEEPPEPPPGSKPA